MTTTTNRGTVHCDVNGCQTTALEPGEDTPKAYLGKDRTYPVGWGQLEARFHVEALTTGRVTLDLCPNHLAAFARWLHRDPERIIDRATRTDFDGYNPLDR